MRACLCAVAKSLSGSGSVDGLDGIDLVHSPLPAIAAAAIAVAVAAAAAVVVAAAAAAAAYIDRQASLPSSNGCACDAVRFGSTHRC